jgi:hypothetical protein
VILVTPETQAFIDWLSANYAIEQLAKRLDEAGIAEPAQRREAFNRVADDPSSIAACAVLAIATTPERGLRANA